MRIHTRTTVTLALGAFLLGGCGFNPGVPGDRTEDVGKAATATYKSWVKAILEGNSENACSMMTKDYIEKTLESSIRDGFVSEGSTCEVLIDTASTLTKAFGADTSDSTITVDKKAPKKVVLIESNPGYDPVHYTLVLESDGWKLADDS